MFFSVIVPIYKVEKYLVNCIESVLGQTFSDFELILVDDGSPDGCPQICDSYSEKDSRIKVIHKPNGGLASARIAGIKIAEGDYVYNLDSDDLIEKDTLECAHKIIQETGCEMVSFAYRWVKDGKTVDVTTDCLDEGLYEGDAVDKYILPQLLMNRDMKHVSFYLSGKAIKREFLLPHQLAVSERISLGEDLCCVVPCYLNTRSVYISKKQVYLYNVRADSLSKEFNTKQIFKIEDVIEEISRHNMDRVPDFEEQLNRYSCFMCFAILASASEGGHFKYIKEIENNIMSSVHGEKIQKAEFGRISLKSKITIFLMKKKCYMTACRFLYLCKLIRTVLKRG